MSLSTFLIKLGTSTFLGKSHDEAILGDGILGDGGDWDDFDEDIVGVGDECWGRQGCVPLACVFRSLVEYVITLFVI